MFIKVTEKLFERENLIIGKEYPVVRTDTQRDDEYYIIINEIGKEIAIHELLAITIEADNDRIEDKDYLREYIGGKLAIDGRMIGYRIANAHSYLRAKGLSREEVEDFKEDKSDIYEILNQIIGLKQSCRMLMCTSYSCGSLADSLVNLICELMLKLKNEYNYDFDNNLMERYYK